MTIETMSGGLRYEIYVVEELVNGFSNIGDKRIRFPDAKIIDKEGNPKTMSCSVNKDPEGREYFYVPNMRNNHRYRLFSDLPKDMYDCISEGNGDVIESSHLTGVHSALSSKHVIYFLDREYGESLRQKFLEEWKDTAFGYAFYVSTHGFGPGSVFDKDGKPIFGKKRKIPYFLTLEEAQEAKPYWVNKVLAANKSYRQWKEKYPDEKDLREKEKQEKDLWIQCVKSDYLDSYLYSASGEDEEYGQIERDPNDVLKIIQVILPKKGKYLLEVEVKEKKVYFDSNYNRVRYPFDHEDTFFQTDEDALIAIDQMCDEIFTVIYDYREGCRNLNREPHFETSMRDYFDDLKLHIGLYVPNKTVWTKHFHRTDLARVLLEKWDKSNRPMNVSTFVTYKELSEIEQPEKKSDKNKPFKPTKTLNGLEALKNL